MAKIEEILRRRSDLSTFLVHLTRDGDEEEDNAESRLLSILKTKKIAARTPFGQAWKRMKSAGVSSKNQRCVCFTETPLEHTSLLIGKIDGRTCQMSRYGIAITKKQGRRRGVNPIWYLDMSPGSHDWLPKSLDQLLAAEIHADMDPDDSDLLKLTPFIEQMGSGPGFTKEFWWEREWRHVGSFDLPSNIIVLCPEERHLAFKKKLAKLGRKARLIDPLWSLEQIIANLAEFDTTEIGPM